MCKKYLKNLKYFHIINKKVPLFENNIKKFSTVSWINFFMIWFFFLIFLLTFHASSRLFLTQDELCYLDFVIFWGKKRNFIMKKTVSKAFFFLYIFIALVEASFCRLLICFFMKTVELWTSSDSLVNWVLCCVEKFFWLAWGSIKIPWIKIHLLYGLF